MKSSDVTIAPERLAVLPRIPRDEGGPVFAEPWQAQAFALAVSLSEQGHYTWKEWTSALTQQLQAAATRGEPDDGSRYYEYWLDALETLVAAKGLTDRGALDTRKDAWAAAYRTTPHGRPVELTRSRAADARWLLLGLAGTLAAWAILQRASMEPFVAGAGLGLLLGMRHALEPDHLAAVSTLMIGERHSAKAAWLGTVWGLGHTTTLIMTGALLLALQAEMPTGAARLLEICVVVLLVGFGVRAIHRSARRDSAGPTHTHRTPTRWSPARVDRWTLARPFLVGAVHGLAGSGALIAVVTTTLPTALTQLGYLLFFGVGTTLAMAALSGLLGWPIARAGANHSLARGLSFVVGCVSIALGLFWGHAMFTESI